MECAHSSAQLETLQIAGTGVGIGGVGKVVRKFKNLERVNLGDNKMNVTDAQVRDRNKFIYLLYGYFLTHFPPFPFPFPFLCIGAICFFG